MAAAVAAVVLALVVVGGMSWWLLTRGAGEPPAARATASTSAPARTPGATATAPDASRALAFQAPSHNIACTLSARGVRCDIGQHDFAAPPAPADCRGAWGGALSVGTGPAGLVCGGRPAQGGEVLPYGETVRRGGYQCTVATTGVDCRATATGHGFRLARESYELY